MRRTRASSGFLSTKCGPVLAVVLVCAPTGYLDLRDLPQRDDEGLEEAVGDLRPKAATMVSTGTSLILLCQKPALSEGHERSDLGQ